MHHQRSRAGVHITKIKVNREADKPARIIYRHPFQPESPLPGPVPKWEFNGKAELVWDYCKSTHILALIVISRRVAAKRIAARGRATDSCMVASV